MNEINNTAPKKSKGISIHAVMWPIIGLLIVLLAGIIITIVLINNENAKLSETMNKAELYSTEVSDLMSLSSLLSETSSTYILTPLSETGESNYGFLIRYNEELQSRQSADEIVEHFKTYDVSQNVLDNITAAAGYANQRLETQLHAIALINAVYPLPDIPPLEGLPLPELTAEEKAYSDEEKLETAKALILSEEYSYCRRYLSESVDACEEELKAVSTNAIEAATSYIKGLRVVLWITTIAIVVLLFLTFIFFYRALVAPLGRFTKQIEADQPMLEKHGVREVRLVASAYNALLRRRDALDNLLRYAAETDTLTQLQNRYGFEQYLLGAEEEGCPVAILLFDVNYLKEMNDANGHSAGDKLLLESAECISTCFGTEEGDNCFRFGGDEFAAVIKDTDPASVEQKIDMFEKEQKKRSISIACGYSFAESVDAMNIKTLIDEADQRMYEQKKRMHENMPKA